jgi:hypothetical protein
MKLTNTRNHYQRLNPFKHTQEGVRKRIGISKKYSGTVEKYIKKSVSNILNQSLGKSAKEAYEEGKGECMRNNWSLNQITVAYRKAYKNLSSKLDEEKA